MPTEFNFGIHRPFAFDVIAFEEQKLIEIFGDHISLSNSCLNSSSGSSSSRPHPHVYGNIFNNCRSSIAESSNNSNNSSDNNDNNNNNNSSSSSSNNNNNNNNNSNNSNHNSSSSSSSSSTAADSRSTVNSSDSGEVQHLKETDESLDDFDDSKVEDGEDNDGGKDREVSSTGEISLSRRALKKKEQQEILSILEEEGVLDEEEGKQADEINKLTGKPLPEDVLLYAVPVCGPYSAIRSFKYSVKLTPGTMKKGKHRPCISRDSIH